MIPVDRIRAAKAQNPTMGYLKIAKIVGSSAGTVRRVLLGIGTPRQLLKNKPRPFRKIPYAGRVGGGGEWNQP